MSSRLNRHCVIDCNRKVEVKRNHPASLRVAGILHETFREPLTTLRQKVLQPAVLAFASLLSHSFGYPGITPVISANGNSNRIVWVLERIDTSNNVALRAYNANNLATELHDSQMNASRDAIGAGTRFFVPLVYRGRVYVPKQTAIVVFGLR